RDVRILLTTLLQRAIPGRSASFPVATAGERCDVLERRPTTVDHAKPKLLEHSPLPAAIQPRLAKTPGARPPCPRAKPQMLLVLTMHRVRTIAMASLV